MVLRRLVIACAFAFVPAVASADGHRAGLFGGGSYLRASNLGGFHVAGDVTLADLSLPNGKFKYFSLLGDFSLHKGTHEGADVTLKTFTGGASFKLAASDTSKNLGGVHFQIGGINGGGGTELVFVVGGTYEYIPHRDRDEQWGFRTQVDGVIPKDGDNKFLRVSAGVLYRWKN